MGEREILDRAQKGFREERQKRGDDDHAEPPDRPPRRSRPEPCANGDGKPNEAPDDPHRLARVFLVEYHTPRGPTEYFWRGEHHRWDGRSYQPVPGKELLAEVCQAIKAEFDRLNLKAIADWEYHQGCNEKGEKVPKPVARKVSTRLLGDALQAVCGLTVLPSTVEPPCWLGDGAEPFPAAETVACKNCLVHLPSVASGKARTCKLTPRFFSPNALDYEFDPKAPAPTAWLDFLGQLWPKDPEAIATLQDWFGYSLLPDTSQQKILMILGPKRSGKGTIARVLTGLVGIRNACAPTLAGLGTNFGMWPLLGKMLAIISDARISGRTDAAIVVERLLSISGEDAQTIDRKNLSQVTCKLPVRFVILTNELPRLNDPSGALVGRLILLRLTQSWYGQENIRLTARLLTELPGILLWAIEGLQRLRERGRFVQPESGKNLVAEMEDLSSPIGAFIRECCDVGPGYEVFIRDLFERWKRWCEEKGRKDPGTEQTFGRDLRAALPGLDVSQARTGGERVRKYLGIRERFEDPLPP